MIGILTEGHIALFLIILTALVLSLCLHEFGHALAAKLYGDDTAQRAGRLTLNPIPHIDPTGIHEQRRVGDVHDLETGYAERDIRPVTTYRYVVSSRRTRPL